MIQSAFADLLDGRSCLSVVLATVAVVIAVVYHVVKNRDLPPGPWGVPYLGHWPFFREEGLHHQIHKMREKYGEISTFTVTGRTYVNLASFKAVREAHIIKADCFVDRVSSFSILGYVFKEGVTFTNGEQWKVLRKFFLTYFKQTGMLSTKENCEAMYDSIKASVEDLKAKEGESVEIVQMFTLRCTEILRRIMFSASDVTDEELLAINEAYEVVLTSMGALNMLMAGDFARLFLFPRIKNYKDVMRSHRFIESALFKMIDDHKSTYKEENIRDIIDSFIKEKREKETKGDPTARLFTDRALMASLYQFIGDGVVAVAAVTGSYLKYTTDHPEEQEKIFAEISEVVGLDRQPTIEDKSKLLYLGAYVQELLRANDFFPFFPSQECTKETHIGGYRIPKGAITLMNMWSAHHDPDVYENPEKFDPGRFLSREGQTRPELPMTFGIGKRACIGEGFVMTQVFLFLATIIQNFKLTSPKDEDPSAFSLENAGHIRLCAVPRDHILK